jgi:uncharacterized pyridoxamine 5'-phosphate oxidase family protein
MANKKTNNADVNNPQVEETKKSLLPEKIEKVFKSYPYSNEVYQTSDGSIFTLKSYAESHAKDLKDKDITTYKRK